MTKTIFKTLLSLLILFSISCGDRPTGSGGTIGDNKETPQTETPASKEFLNNFDSLAHQYTGKIVEFHESSDKYSFNENADMTVTSIDYNTGEPRTETYKFWGMDLESKEFAYYYNEMSGGYNTPYYAGLKLDGDTIIQEYEYQKIKLVIQDSPQNNTPEAEAWKNSVKGKQFTSKSMTTYNYTFESGGNIKETTGSGEYAHTKTYYFWGALDSSRVVYYKKQYYDENQEVWDYCGFSFDIVSEPKKINKYSEYSQAYHNSLKIWNQNNLDSEGNPKPNANFETYPLPKRSDIDWSKYTTGTLTTR